MGFLEVIGVATILPFMQLVAEPAAIEQNRWLVLLNGFFGFADQRQFLIWFGVGIVILIAATNLFAIFTIWLQYKYSWGVAHQLSIRLLRNYLRKPYPFFLTSNASDLQTYVVAEVGSLTGGVIIPFIEIISRTFVSIVIFLLLLKVDLMVSLIMFGSLGGAYLIIYLSRQKFLKQIGKHRMAMNLLRFKSLRELLSGIKTIRVYQKEPFFFQRFANASQGFCEVQPQYNLVLAAPRYLLEFLAFGSILGVTIYLFIADGEIQSALPRLSLYAVAGYRVLPALQKAFSAAAKLRHNLPILEKLHQDLVANSSSPTFEQSAVAQIPFQRELDLDRIQFAYEENSDSVLNDLSLQIPRGSTVAFVGSTGSGKTTLVDLIVGLLKPDSGQIKVDGQPILNGQVAAWRQHIAYVPQEVFLFDDTILANIVMGGPEVEVDETQLWAACRTADIYDFIQGLPNGWKTEVGDRGVRLSGGQRQRLGLARALYAQPDVLILDEATSALDAITEKGVIAAIRALPATMTTIFIAHRLSTVRHADCIYMLADGKVVAQGTYDELVLEDATFRTMAQLSR